MFRYNLLNDFGFLVKASENVEPPSTDSAVSARTFVIAGFLDWSERVVSARRRGRPASRRIASCLVNTVRSFGLIVGAPIWI